MSFNGLLLEYFNCLQRDRNVGDLIESWLILLETELELELLWEVFRDYAWIRKVDLDLNLFC